MNNINKQNEKNNKMNNNDQNSSNFENVHWADNSAKRVIDTFPNEKVYILASGITPSGIIHIGHIREILTSEFVRKSLEKKGKKTKFIYSWDSYDAFRKVPKNLPESWNNYLRLPDSMVADPNKKYDSFAEKYMSEAEESLKVFNFPIEFQRQHLLQTSGIYAEGIRNHLRSRKEIRLILDEYRENPLAKDWLPISLYCENCNKDTVKISNYDEEYSLDYVCKCGFKNTINFRKIAIVKLPWRLDWPMRWDYYGVNFEPGGKDHSTPGGSYDTACKIIKLVSKREAPVYTFYNFVGMKGQGGKISSSSGNGSTIFEVLQVYTAELVLFLFAGTRPNAELDISFDLDVLKIYEDFDKLERLYFGLEEEKNLKKLTTQNRIYELSMVNGRKIPSKMPFQFSFRNLVNVIQASDFDFKKVKLFYSSNINNKFDELRLKERFFCVSNWIKNFAPDEMKFEIQDKLPVNLSELEIKVITELVVIIKKVKTSDEIFAGFRSLSEKYEFQLKDFFKLMYNIIINKEKGPKLAGFIFDNKKKVLLLLDK